MLENVGSNPTILTQSRFGPSAHGPKRSWSLRKKAAKLAGPEPVEKMADSEVVAAGMQRPALTRKAYVRFIPSELLTPPSYANGPSGAA